MRIFGLGVPELVIILIIVLLIFGPKNIPKLGRAIGKGAKNLKEGIGAGKRNPRPSEAGEEVVEVISVEDEPGRQSKSTEADSGNEGEHDLEAADVHVEAKREAPGRKTVKRTVLKKKVE